MSVNTRKSTPRSRAWKAKTRKSAPRNVDADAITHREAFGGRRNPAPDPPSLTQSPWNKVTVVKIHKIGTTSQTGLVNTGDVVKWLKDQLDPSSLTFSATPTVSLRILSVDVWNITGNYVTLAAWDYSSDTQDDDALGSWVDSGNKTSPPCIGYTWPISNRQRPLSNTTAVSKRRVFTVHATTGDNVLQHIHLLWRTNVTEMTVTSQFIKLDTVYHAIRSVRAVNEKILDGMPGLVPIIGAAKVAVVGARDEAGEDSESASKTECSQSSVENSLEHQEIAELRRQLAELTANVEISSDTSSFCEA